MDVSHLLDGLNPAPRDAVSAAPGHYLVLAGAMRERTPFAILSMDMDGLKQVNDAS